MVWPRSSSALPDASSVIFSSLAVACSSFTSGGYLVGEIPNLPSKWFKIGVIYRTAVVAVAITGKNLRPEEHAWGIGVSRNGSTSFLKKP
ncbi:hypothetical protein AAHA92_21899 [Salvia divinorum]|uniref:Secreted protein n=1 Tax=Salvia divinorum TaxID=28513 RepID=A0ABD1GLY1_SALDI